MKYQKKTSTVFATEAQKRQARHMRARHMSYRLIGEALGFAAVTVYFWFKPQRRYFERQLFGRVLGSSKPTNADIAARLAEIPPDHRDLTGIICGDPVFERSALAAKERRR